MVLGRMPCPTMNRLQTRNRICLVDGLYGRLSSELAVQVGRLRMAYIHASAQLVYSFVRAGNLNLASRDLPCIPSILFEVHLGVTPEPLALVPNEPAHPPNDRPGRRRGGNNNVSWYEAQDLEVLKAGNNEILEIQPEISLFGSLKHIDVCLHILPGHGRVKLKQLALVTQQQTFCHPSLFCGPHGSLHSRPLTQPTHCTPS